MEETTITTNKQAGEEILKEWGEKERERIPRVVCGIPKASRDVTVTGM